MDNHPDRPLFEIRNLHKSFSRQPVLQGIDLEINRGGTTVVIGPSGCGKTVLLKHLIALLRPDHGEVIFDGMRIDKLSEARLIPIRRRCGFLFQGGALFDSETVGRNIALPLLQHTDHPPAEIDRLVRQKLSLVGLEHAIDRLPAELSGGEKRRVALARAIALSPEVVLYDEPTTGLDPIRADIINQLILKLSRELAITSIVVTHDMNSAYRIADRIVMLDQGRIIADGSRDQIRHSPNQQVQRFILGRSDATGTDQPIRRDAQAPKTSAAGPPATASDAPPCPHAPETQT